MPTDITVMFHQRLYLQPWRSDFHSLSVGGAVSVMLSPNGSSAVCSPAPATEPLPSAAW